MKKDTQYHTSGHAGYKIKNNIKTWQVEIKGKSLVIKAEDSVKAKYIAIKQLGLNEDIWHTAIISFIS